MPACVPQAEGEEFHLHPCSSLFNYTSDLSLLFNTGELRRNGSRAVSKDDAVNLPASLFSSTRLNQTAQGQGTAEGTACIPQPSQHDT